MSPLLIEAVGATLGFVAGWVIGLMMVTDPVDGLWGAVFGACFWPFALAGLPVVVLNRRHRVKGARCD